MARRSAIPIQLDDLRSPSKHRYTHNSSCVRASTLALALISAFILILINLNSSKHHNVKFKSLADISSTMDYESRSLSICIVTLSLIGPTKNGGIATASTALAQAHTSNGDNVTILYVPGQQVQTRNIAHWTEFYRIQGIHIAPLPGIVDSVDIVPSLRSKFITQAYKTYLWLKMRDGEFDIVYFHDWHGQGYYAAKAKAQGIAFKNSLIITVIHCPTLFYLNGSSQFVSKFDHIISDFLERKQTQYSDVVISPSEFMLDWVQNKGWSLPKQTFVQPNILTNSVLNRITERELEGTKQSIQEIVFFGRLETLKGFYEFLNALDSIAREVNSKNFQNFKVTFLGTSNFGKRKNAHDIISARSKEKNWPFEVKVMTESIHPEAISYISEPGKLAIIPSLHENSPYSVLECIALGIPFLASNVGGVSELISASEQEFVLFEPTSKAIGEKIKYVLQSGITPIRGKFDLNKNGFVWIDSAKKLYHDSIQVNQVLKFRENYPLVSICIPFHNRELFFRYTLDAVFLQNYPNFEVIIVDDGSDDPKSIKMLEDLENSNNEILVIRESNRYPGAARNTAAIHARGKYVLFLDDDDIPKQNWIKNMVTVAEETEADIVTIMCDFFKGNSTPFEFPTDRQTRWVALGDALDVGMFENVFGSYSALVRKESFEKIGGYSEDFGSTFEDYEFFAKALLNGMKLEIIPEALIWYRKNPQSHLMKSTNYFLNSMRALRPYLSAFPSELRNSILMGYGAARKWKNAEVKRISTTEPYYDDVQ